VICRCAFCDRQFESDVDSDECPACKQKQADELAERARAEAQATAPAPEDRKWSRAWMRRDR